MNKIELIRKLRETTFAAISDCSQAIEEANFDFEKAIDIIKTKGKNIVSKQEGKVAAEGIFSAYSQDNISVLVEVNSQTDFVCKMPEFIKFAETASYEFLWSIKDNKTFSPYDGVLKSMRENLISKTKENIVIRRWWSEQTIDPHLKVFSYLHSNSKLGALIKLQASSQEIVNSPEFNQLGNDLAMQVVAMSPLAITQNDLSKEVVDRQKEIVEEQVKNNPPKQTVCIPGAISPTQRMTDGKMRKFYEEVCLLNQESIIVPKNSVAEVIKKIETKYNGLITVLSMRRAQVGEGIVKKQENFADEVGKLI